MKTSAPRPIEYSTEIIWDGNTGHGTSDYASYGRDYRIRVAGKPDLLGSAAAEFRGDPRRYDPEDLFVAAVSACHMLAYLALCARRGVRVLAYEDHASGQLSLDGSGGGQFSAITLRPRVRIADARDQHVARELHDTARAQCFIACSCRVPIGHEPTVLVEPNAPVSVP